MTEPCFHCGAALTPNFHHAVQFGGQRRPVCCGGCEAAANLILSQGLERDYGVPARRRRLVSPYRSVSGRRSAARRAAPLHPSARGWLARR
jgi:hypothetical protein